MLLYIVTTSVPFQSVYKASEAIIRFSQSRGRYYFRIILLSMIFYRAPFLINI